MCIRERANKADALWDRGGGAYRSGNTRLCSAVMWIQNRSFWIRSFSGNKKTVLRIRDVYPGSQISDPDFYPSRIPDPDPHHWKKRLLDQDPERIFRSHQRKNASNPTGSRSTIQVFCSIFRIQNLFGPYPDLDPNPSPRNNPGLDEDPTNFHLCF
jgi:hypothetical protein